MPFVRRDTIFHDRGRLAGRWRKNAVVNTKVYKSMSILACYARGIWLSELRKLALGTGGRRYHGRELNPQFNLRRP